MDIAPGATAEVSGIVDADRTAHAMGNRGVHVFATPFVIGMLEDAARRGATAPSAVRRRIGRHHGGDEAPRRHARRA